MSDIGYTFNPSDHVLVAHYLIGKVTGVLPTEDCVVGEIDLYSENFDLKELFRERLRHGNDNLIYCFTRLKKKTENGKRFNRTSGSGNSICTWKGQDKGKDIFDQQGRHIGTKKLFTCYTNKRPAGFCMTEYSLAGQYESLAK
ncbi:hypothetical protein NMG60_11023506 [Bertholletia excelsa]